MLEIKGLNQILFQIFTLFDAWAEGSALPKINKLRTIDLRRTNSHDRILTTSLVTGFNICNGALMILTICDWRHCKETLNTKWME